MSTATWTGGAGNNKDKMWFLHAVKETAIAFAAIWVFAAFICCTIAWFERR